MIEEYIIAILQNHISINNRISSKDLLMKLNVVISTTNRKMRQAIESLRQQEQGSLICSTTKSGGGYFLATTKAELENYLRQDEHRCLEMWKRIRKQRQVAGLSLNEELQQPVLFQTPEETTHYDY